jgi:hypothetical protein
MQSPELVLAHQPCDAVLASGFAGLAEIQENSWGAIDTLAGRERRADQAKQAGVFLRVV